MNFTLSLAKKYVKQQKRHSALTMLSIMAAVIFITVIFNLFSTYIKSSAKLVRADNPWHASVYGLTQEQSQEFEKCKYIEKTAFVKNGVGSSEDGYTTKTAILFTKNVPDCENAINDALIAIGIPELETDLYPVDLNKRLLSMEFIGFEGKIQLMQLVAIFYIFVLIMLVCVRLIIDTAFEISSKEREKQFGILQSVGATKKQIVGVIVKEGILLSDVGIPAGLVLGTGLSYVIYRILMKSGFSYLMTIDADLAEQCIAFHVSPAFILLTVVTALGWVMLSAYGVGMRITKMTPIQAIQGNKGKIKKVKKHTLFGLIFGWTGRLASRNIRRNKKRYIITILSITISMTMFISFKFVIRAMNVVTDENAAQYSGNDIDVYCEVPDEPYSEGDLQNGYYDFEKQTEILRDTGYFKNVQAFIYEFGEIYDASSLPFSEEYKKLVENEYGQLSDENHMMVFFVNEETYSNLFNGNPEIPYSELAENDGYLIQNYYYYSDEKNPECKILNAPVGTDFNGKINTEEINITVEEETGLEEIDEIYMDIGINIMGEIDSPLYRSSILTFITTEEQYKKLFGTNMYLTYYLSFYLDLAESDEYTDEQLHNLAIEFLDENEYEYGDNFGNNLAAKRQISSVRILGYALIALITFIAAVNMINIISTGILNRRPEIAAMKSLGISSGQLTKLIIIECLQYAVVSGVFALILSELMLLATTSGFMSMLYNPEDEMFKTIFSYTEPISGAVISVAAAFVIGIAAAAIPLRKIRKESITEIIKDSDK
ncbi:MAG: ABC transporter permease [Ruminococcus sp.]|nr:ABC transporter permease [Ruminococcus sp.]